MSNSNFFNMLLEQISAKITAHEIAFNELTLVVDKANIISVLTELKSQSQFAFESLTDVCGVDYGMYGKDEWQTEEISSEGFNRGAQQMELHSQDSLPTPERFAVVYHLTSFKQNKRLRVKAYLAENDLMIDSAVPLWPNADWFEREAFDMFGILFRDHPDLRRILTDYGFIGHPLRKDFPLVGNVEARYDFEQQRVVYEPVSIEPRTLVPRVIRSKWQEDSLPTSQDEVPANA